MKKDRGITLIALVITIIVLLILAGVTIQTLTGDNGLLSKAGEAKEKNEESEICEQIKLAYLDYEMAKFKNSNLDVKEYLKISLEKTYGENSIKDIKEKNGKYTITMKDDSVYKHNTNTGETYRYIDIIEYNGKTRETLAPNDDFMIGTEKFKVFSKTDAEIKAMPYYNLKLNSNPMRQATKEEVIADQEGKSTFSTTDYWTHDFDEINMSDSKNNIQKYIASYEITLKNMVKDDIKVRIAKYSELNANGVTDIMRAPAGNSNRSYLLAWILL